MRYIKSSRPPTSPDHSHFCPLARERIASGGCAECPYLSNRKQNEASYEVECSFPAEELTSFEPAQAYDKEDLPHRMGDNPLALPNHTIVEPKYDGARAILHFTSAGIRVTSRRINQEGVYSEFTANVPQLKHVQYPEDLIGTILDAECFVPATGANGKTGSLACTMAVVTSKPENAIAEQKAYGWAQFIVFTAVKIGGRDVKQLTYAARRKMTQKLIEGLDQSGHAVLVSMPSYDMPDPVEREKYLVTALELGMEGIVLKNPSAAYDDRYAMIKVKEHLTLDCVVTGYDHGKVGGKYEHTVGALRVSVIDDERGTLREICNVVPGSDAKREELKVVFDQATLADKKICDLNILVELEAQSWTKEYRLRHPRLLRYRMDKSNVSTVDFRRVERK